MSSPQIPAIVYDKEKAAHLIYTPKGQLQQIYMKNIEHVNW